ncbi:MAG: B12-binding domain-containing radical SAM protein [Patescibacteria group bacterium]
MTKILLIFPPYSLKEEFGALSEVGNMQPPLGIGYLGAVLEKEGFEVRIFDAPPLKWGIRKIVFEAEKFSPDFIGLSVSTADFNKAVKLGKALKKSLSSPIIIGGSHITALPDEMKRFSCFDIGVIGEGEETIVELIKALKKERMSPPSPRLRRVKGIVFREGKRVIKTSPRLYIENLDSLPFPARHLMPALSSYHPTPATFKKFPVGTMITSRGCPYRCTFCFRGVFGNRWRFRSPENVVSEMEVLISKFGAKEIRIWDDTFNADPERVKTICRLMIKRGLRFPWTCLARVDRIDRQMLALMKRAGCWQISYGIESGNEKILATINKGITKKMVKKAIEVTYQVGIRSLGFFILGLPGETEQTLRETIEFAKSLPLEAANFTIATPYPGTDLWFQAKKEGFLKNVSYDKLLVNLPEKLYFVPEGLNARLLKDYERVAYKEFYRNPKFILRQLGQIESWSEFYRKLKAFFTIQAI